MSCILFAFVLGHSLLLVNFIKNSKCLDHSIGFGASSNNANSAISGSFSTQDGVQTLYETHLSKKFIFVMVAMHRTVYIIPFSFVFF